MASYLLGVSLFAFMVVLAVYNKLPQFNSLENLRKIVIIVGSIMLFFGFLLNSSFLFGMGFEGIFLYLAIRYGFFNFPTLERVARHELGVGIGMLIISLVILAL